MTRAHPKVCGILGQYLHGNSIWDALGPLVGRTLRASDREYNATILYAALAIWVQLARNILRKAVHAIGMFSGARQPETERKAFRRISGLSRRHRRVRVLKDVSAYPASRVWTSELIGDMFHRKAILTGCPIDQLHAIYQTSLLCRRV